MSCATNVTEVAARTLRLVGWDAKNQPMGDLKFRHKGRSSIRCSERAWARPNHNVPAFGDCYAVEAGYRPGRPDDCSALGQGEPYKKSTRHYLRRLAKHSSAVR
jgi:hypothetical protein